MMLQTFRQQSGFSLVETLVAISILLIVIVGPLTLVSNSARSTTFANDQVMAFFLAQEGLELAQAARDNILIPEFSATPPATNAWDTFTSTSGLYQRCFTSAGCGLDQVTNVPGTINVVNCATTDACLLNFNASPNQRSRYTHTATGNIPSKYTRTITMNQSPAGQVSVLSRVSWRSDGQRAEQSVEAVTYLIDVYGR